MFVVDDDARKLIYEKVPSSVLRARAREMGMRTLREDGTRKVLAGMTTAEEVVRATVSVCSIQKSKKTFVCYRHKSLLSK
jgi:type II secretory ATPase GspE/PulE/Tfp pilus assembly ATPase PilB-like protein